MLARRLNPMLKQMLCGCTFLQDNWLLQATRTYGIEHEKIMYNWREKEADLYRSKLTDDPEKPKKVIWHPTSAPKEKHIFSNIMKWYTQTEVESVKYSQQFIPDRHIILGSDLACAHFLISYGGRVRFRGSNDWIEKDNKGSHNLPTTFDPEYTLEAIDINGIDLHYEGLSNMCNLVKLKWLSLKDCKNIDDWGLDKISAEYPQLEYLDISGSSVTERGLESLYRMFSLKKLIVTNHYKSVAFELTCLMLEDCLPGLVCDIHVPEKKAEE